jgi:hypothetical protein
VDEHYFDASRHAQVQGRVHARLEAAVRGALNGKRAELPGWRGYSAPMTVKVLFTKTWCGQLTAIMWTS